MPSDDAVNIWNAGLDAVRARPLVEQSCRIDGDHLVIEERSWARDDYDRVLVVGAGKAATEMARGLFNVIGDWLPMDGWINVPEGTDQEVPGITVHPARPAGVNEPTAEGVRGTREILKLVAEAGPRDLCIALISGGGSALLPAPVDGITLEDKLSVIRLLSASGADIVELNTVRKHLSSVKGGGLLQACRARSLVTLILSDVLGDPLDAIASGPTVIDPTSKADALAVLSRFDPQRKLDQRIYEALGRRDDRRSDAAGKDVANLVIGNNAVAVDAAGIRAEQLGYNHAMQSARSCEGSAEDVGRLLAQMAIEMLRDQNPTHRINCLITGGEPTVSLCPKEIRGRGGRNQQLILAAYQHLLQHDLSDREWESVALVSGGTDGEDGPTNAAGAFLSEQVHRRAVESNLDVVDHLRRNDAYSFFESAGGLLMTGPTGTNVCDVRVAISRPV